MVITFNNISVLIVFGEHKEASFKNIKKQLNCSVDLKSTLNFSSINQFYLYIVKQPRLTKVLHKSKQLISCEF